ncbi:MAG: carboxypeptidase-like regulatory domain-containing protein, partial [Candidatus Thermoplasmatota archaeon]
MALYILVLVALAPLAGAEHEADHRYYVVGTVTDGSGEPLCGLTVRATDADVTSTLDTNRTATTDGSGHYRIQLHLHSQEVASSNSNEGDTLLVTVEGTGVSGTAA